MEQWKKKGRVNAPAYSLRWRKSSKRVFTWFPYFAYLNSSEKTPQLYPV